MKCTESRTGDRDAGASRRAGRRSHAHSSCGAILIPSERYLRSRNDFRLELLLNLEFLKWMVQVEGQRIGAIGLALMERLVMAPPVMALAPLSGPAAPAPR